MRILVTGGAGMLGSACLFQLSRHGHEVCGFDLHEQVAALRRLDPGFEDIDFVQGSILDRDLMRKTLLKSDVLLHFAGYLGVQRTEEDPMRALRINLEATRDIVELCAQTDVQKFIYSSSSEVYGNGSLAKIPEDAPLNARNAYAISKLAAEQYVALAINSHQAKIGTSVRLFNTYGPRQAPHFVIPKFVAMARSDQTLTVYGSGEQVRSFMHAQDAATAMTKLVEFDDPLPPVLNVGNAYEAISMLELAHLVTDTLGSRAQPSVELVGFDHADRSSSREIWHRVCDSTQIEALLGWKPQVRLPEGIVDVAERLA